MLTKDVKDILEGIHFFLFDGLKQESLSGKAECMRTGLLLQLQILHQTYPTLQFANTDSNQNRSNGLNNFINDKNTQNTVNSSRLSTSSGGSANYSTGYSNGSSIAYSGDGVISEPQDKIEEESSSAEGDATQEEYEELYEEFDDNSEFASFQDSTSSPTPVKESNEPLPKNQKILDDSYSTDGDLVPFRVNIACCDYHGLLVKKSKNFLKNSKFHSVLANGMLYLYQRETDDRQRKVIDLLNYSAKSASTDEKKKKEFTFELVAPGKKTHAFSCTTSRERDQWIKYLNNSLPINVRRYNDYEKSPLTIMDAQHAQDEEVYEELSPDDEHDAPELRGANQYTDNSNRESGTYYEVPDEDEDQADAHTVALRKPPGRPPLPQVLRDLKQQARPLPVTPGSRLSSTEEDPGIYWEIEEEEQFETYENDDFINENNNRRLHARSLSQEIFDTINERGPILPEQSSPDQLDEEFEYDVPGEINLVIRETQLTGDSSIYEDDVAEYQVPNSDPVPVPGIYQVPPSKPVPVKPRIANKPPVSKETSPSTPTHKEIEADARPSTNVRDLIAKLNQSETITPRSSLRQPSLKGKPSERETSGSIPERNKTTIPKVMEAQKKNPFMTGAVEALKSQLLADGENGNSDKYVAKFAYVGSKSNELSFSRGEAILITDCPVDADWWTGVVRGKSGLVQKAYLRKVPC